MINIQRIFKSDRLTRSFTGLSIKGFNQLLPTFEQVLQKIKLKEYQKQLKQGKRQRQLGGGRKGSLKTIELKLLFILFYFKCYPTEDLAGIIFNLDKSNISRNIQILTIILEKTLGKKMSLPRRRISSIKEFLEMFPGAKDVFVDATERPIPRPKNSKKQRKNYSGKKKAHTKKNIVISDEKNKIGYLGSTLEGKEHDYTIFKDEISPEVIPKNVTIWTDKGFTGINSDYPEADVMLPKKKPKGKELSDSDKENNKTVSGIRILSEHAIGGVKRLRIVTDKIRNRSERFIDKAMFLSCGLWNYQLEYC